MTIMPQETEILDFLDNDISIKNFPDRSIRWLFKDQENVRGLLEIVGSELVEMLDFNQLTPLNRNFISNTLREQESDILFSAPFHGESEMEGLLIYILIEHQSTVDATMGFRVLFYMTQIWDAQRKMWESKSVPKSQRRFSPVLPIVFYTGDRKWNTPVTLKAIMDIPNVLARFVPTFDTLFLSVKETDEANLTKTDHPLGWLLNVLQKEDADKETMSAALTKSLSKLNALHSSQKSQMQKAICYLLLLVRHRRQKVEHEELIELIDQHTREINVGTISQSIDDAFIKQGEIQATQENILKLIQSRFSSVHESLSESIANEIGAIQCLPELKLLFNRVLAAKTLKAIGLRSTQEQSE